MATYTLQRVSSGFIPVSVGFNDTGAFTIGFPVSSDQNLPASYSPAAGDVIKLGLLPKGFTILQAWIDAGMTSGSSTWHFGDTGPSSRISGTNDVVVAGMYSRYYFLRGQPAVFYGSSIIPDLSLATSILITMTCNAVNGSGTFTGGVGFRGTMDLSGSLLTPAGGSGVPMGASESLF